MPATSDFAASCASKHIIYFKDTTDTRGPRALFRRTRSARGFGSACSRAAAFSAFPQYISGSRLPFAERDTLDSDPKYRVHLIIQSPDFPYSTGVNLRHQESSRGPGLRTCNAAEGQRPEEGTAYVEHVSRSSKTRSPEGDGASATAKSASTGNTRRRQVVIRTNN
jgi:hypothetical protein